MRNRFFRKLISFCFPVKTGLVSDIIDERDYLADGKEIPLGGSTKDEVSPLVEIKNDDSYLNLMNTWVFDQGKGTVSCTAHAATLQRVIMEVLLTKNKSFFLNPNQLWENQKNYPATYAPGVGDYLNAPLKSLKKQPLYSPSTDRTYTIKDYRVVHHSAWKSYLRKGYPILSGGVCSRGFVDQAFEWVRGTLFGHAWLFTGFDDDNQRFICYDSRGNWLFRKKGEFYVSYDDVAHLFRGWIITI